MGRVRAAACAVTARPATLPYRSSPSCLRWRPLPVLAEPASHTRLMTEYDAASRLVRAAYARAWSASSRSCAATPWRRPRTRLLRASGRRRRRRPPCGDLFDARAETAAPQKPIAEPRGDSAPRPGSAAARVPSSPPEREPFDLSTRARRAHARPHGRHRQPARDRLLLRARRGARLDRARRARVARRRSPPRRASRRAGGCTAASARRSRPTAACGRRRRRRLRDAARRDCPLRPRLRPGRARARGADRVGGDGDGAGVERRAPRRPRPRRRDRRARQRSVGRHAGARRGPDPGGRTCRLRRRVLAADAGGRDRRCAAAELDPLLVVATASAGVQVVDVVADAPGGHHGRAVAVAIATGRSCSERASSRPSVSEAARPARPGRSCSRPRPSPATRAAVLYDERALGIALLASALANGVLAAVSVPPRPRPRLAALGDRARARGARHGAARLGRDADDRVGGRGGGARVAVGAPARPALPARGSGWLGLALVHALRSTRASRRSSARASTPRGRAEPARPLRGGVRRRTGLAASSTGAQRRLDRVHRQPRCSTSAERITASSCSRSRACSRSRRRRSPARALAELGLGPRRGHRALGRDRDRARPRRPARCRASAWAAATALLAVVLRRELAHGRRALVLARPRGRNRARHRAAVRARVGRVSAAGPIAGGRPRRRCSPRHRGRRPPVAARARGRRRLLVLGGRVPARRAATRARCSGASASLLAVGAAFGLLEGFWLVLALAGAAAAVTLLARFEERLDYAALATARARARGHARHPRRPPSDLLRRRSATRARASGGARPGRGAAACTRGSARSSARSSIWTTAVVTVFAASLAILELSESLGGSVETAFQRGHTAVSALLGPDRPRAPLRRPRPPLDRASARRLRPLRRSAS